MDCLDCPDMAQNSVAHNSVVDSEDQNFVGSIPDWVDIVPEIVGIFCLRHGAQYFVR